jgi:hypothetical protein
MRLLFARRRTVGGEEVGRRGGGEGGGQGDSSALVVWGSHMELLVAQKESVNE